MTPLPKVERGLGKVPHKGALPRLSLPSLVIKAALRLSLPTGLSWEDCKLRCPPGVVPACHNSKDTVTISGPQVCTGKQGLVPKPPLGGGKLLM